MVDAVSMFVNRESDSGRSGVEKIVIKVPDCQEIFFRFHENQNFMTYPGNVHPIDWSFIALSRRF